MRKLGRFFKMVWNFFITVLVVIFIFIVIVLGLICAVFEVFFKHGRVAAVAFLSGVAKGHQKKKEIQTVMKSTMESKRTH